MATKRTNIEPDTAPIRPVLTFTDAEVRTMDLFATLITECMQSKPGLSLPQIMQISRTVHDLTALRNKINDHVMEYLPKDSPLV